MKWTTEPMTLARFDEAVRENRVDLPEGWRWARAPMRGIDHWWAKSTQSTPSSSHQLHQGEWHSSPRGSEVPGPIRDAILRMKDCLAEGQFRRLYLKGSE